MTLDIIIPCYNESECIVPLYNAISRVLNRLNIEWTILFINDGSQDDTLDKIKTLLRITMNKGQTEIKYISFSRNFGKEAAIYAGLKEATADYVALMDADLQHPPCLLKEMIEALNDGYDCCGARRVTRQGEPFIRSLLSRTFYKVINHVTSMHLVQGGSDFRMMKRRVVDAILLMQERERFTKGIFSWVGFETKWIEYENIERVAGQTKWSTKSLARV